MIKNSNINKYKNKATSKNFKNKSNVKIIKGKETEKKSTKLPVLNININKKNNTIFEKTSKYLPIIIIIVVTLTYINSINNNFINWDDDRYVTGNKHLELTSENIKTYFSEPYFVMYIPFTMVSYMIDYKLGGEELKPEIFHTHNLLLHILNSLLVYLVILNLFDKNKREKIIYAFFAALLFGLHPLHVESVAWIAERKDVLYSFYYLLSVFFYIKFSENNNKKLYFLSFIFFLFSLFSKTQAVVLPLILIAIDYLNKNFLHNKEKFISFFSLKDKEQLKLFSNKIPFLVLSIIFGIIAIKSSGTNEPFSESISTNSTTAIETGHGAYESIVLMSYSFLLYTAESVIPFKQSAIHPYPFNAGEMPSYYNLYLLFPLLILVIFIWAWIKKKKIIIFSMLFFVLNIFIVLKVKNFIISEHYLYLPTIGISLILVFLALSIINKKNNLKGFILTFSLIYIIFLSVVTFNRTKVFTNSLTFWNDVTSKYKTVVVAYFNRGNYLQSLGDNETDNINKATDFYNQAIEDYTKAINLQNSNIGAYSNRGITFAKITNYQKAIDDFNQVIVIDSTYPNVYSNRGNAYGMLGKWDKAIGDYNKAISKNPNFADAIYNRGIAYSNINKFEEAIEDFNKVLSLKNFREDIVMHRGLAYYFLNEYRKALTDINKYLKTNPNDYNSIYYQALCYEQLNFTDTAEQLFTFLNTNYPQIIEDIKTVATNLENGADYNQNIDLYKKALKLFNNILKIDPNNSDAYMRIGIVYGKMGDLNLAIYNLTIAINLNPQNAQAYTDRGYAYNLTNNNYKAMSDYNTAIKIDSTNYTAFFNRALLHEKNGDLNKSLIDLNKCIILKNDYGTAYYRRGIILQKTGKTNEACKDWQTALQLNITDAQAYLNKYCN